MGEVLWNPPGTAWSTSAIGRFASSVAARTGRRFETYEDLWRWSVEDLEDCWSALWGYFAVGAPVARSDVLENREMPGARWFSGRSLNYSARVLARREPRAALVGVSECRGRLEWSYAELADEVGRVAGGFAELGVGPGDRVAGYLPNIPEAVACFLAAASLGALWSSCPPEFGTRAVLDRFGEFQPTVLVAVDGYRYGGRDVERLAELETIRAGLPSLHATVFLAYRDPSCPPPEGAIAYGALGTPAKPATVAVEFSHPLWVLFSSGTTGPPKAIVQGHGGILLEHLKGLALHCDLGEDDRFFWFTSTGWMMWNYLVAGLLVGATVVCYDGSPGAEGLERLWRLASEEMVTFFGTSAPFIQASRRAGLEPGRRFDLSKLRAVGSTASPLSAEGFRWVYEHVHPDVLLSSMSGGTDLCNALVGGCPLVPVYAGEISCRWLGAAVEAFDEDGRPVRNEEGELVLTAPMPSMPVSFLNDPDGSRYRAAYFERFPGVWAHGDWATITDRHTVVISGRSDATLNRGGVRLGSAEFYAVVEEHPLVRDSLVVHLADATSGRDELVLFVVLAPDATSLSALEEELRQALRVALSPRHVPDRILSVPVVPRTLSGKKLELPVKRILEGASPTSVANPELLAEPSSLDAFVALAAAEREAIRGT